jgi:hypothetical protein
MILAAFCAITGPAAHAACTVSVDISFREGAPRDRFTIANTSSSASIASVELDLDGSAGRLVFDTVEGGTGVEVFQPYRSESGDAGLIGAPVVADGATALALQFEQFGPGQSYTFSIDVDDRLTRSDMGQIMVSGREIEGAMVTVGLRDATGAIVRRRAAFDDDSAARIAETCS